MPQGKNGSRKTEDDGCAQARGLCDCTGFLTKLKNGGGIYFIRDKKGWKTLVP